MWAVATLVQVVSPGHVVPNTVNYVMGIVATGFFGGALIASRRREVTNGSPARDDEDDDIFDGPGGYYRTGEKK